MGREATDTARCRTCSKELEKVLWPANVTGVERELLALLVVPINDYLCNIGAEPLRIRPLIGWSGGLAPAAPDDNS